MKKFLLISITALILFSCGSPKVTQEEYDFQVSELTNQVNKLQDEVEDLKNSIVAYESEVSIEQGFKDIFASATRVDRLTPTDFLNCNAEIPFEAKVGVKLKVEVAFAKREYYRDARPNMQPILIYPEALGYPAVAKMELEDVRDNAWSSLDTAYNVVAYRGEISLPPVITDEPRETEGPRAGTYRLRFWEDSRSCKEVGFPEGMPTVWNFDDWVAGTLLVAWYVE